MKQALIFAAGLGERMRPLTNTTPKPLLHVGGKPLIVWHLEQLQRLGVQTVVVNTSWLADQFPSTLGDGSQWNLQLRFSQEPYPPLETGGGMLNAWRQLDPHEPLLAVNGDVWTDYDFTGLATIGRDTLAHLVMVDNPSHNANGDFALNGQQLESDGDERHTFSGLGIYRYELFEGWNDHVTFDLAADDLPRFKLAPLLRKAMHAGRVSGELHRGRWTDVGTPERLALLDRELSGDGLGLR